MYSTEKSLAASSAAHMSWANTLDRQARTAPAREALEAKFLAEVDGDPLRAESLRKAYFRNLALKSAQARRRAKECVQSAESAEAELQELLGGDAA